MLTGWKRWRMGWSRSEGAGEGWVIGQQIVFFMRLKKGIGESFEVAKRIGRDLLKAWLGKTTLIIEF